MGRGGRVQPVLIHGADGRKLQIRPAQRPRGDRANAADALPPVDGEARGRRRVSRWVVCWQLLTCCLLACSQLTADRAPCAHRQWRHGLRAGSASPTATPSRCRAGGYRTPGGERRVGAGEKCAVMSSGSSSAATVRCRSCRPRRLWLWTPQGADPGCSS